MRRSLTLTKLRSLVRLYREDVEGAADELNEVLTLRWDELAAALRSSPTSIARIRDHEDPVHALAIALESHADARRQRVGAGRLAARVAAAALIEGAHESDGRIGVPSTPLRRVLALWPGGGDLSFGQRGSLDIAKLRNLLRACPDDPLLVALHARELVVRYLTPGGYGRVRLALRTTRGDTNVLHVPIADPQRDVASNVCNGLGSVSLPTAWPADNEQDHSRMKPPNGPELPYTQQADQG